LQLRRAHRADAVGDRITDLVAKSRSVPFGVGGRLSLPVLQLSANLTIEYNDDDQYDQYGKQRV
jgi:hypothetical protein